MFFLRSFASNPPKLSTESLSNILSSFQTTRERQGIDTKKAHLNSLAALQATAVTNAAQMQDQTKVFKEKAALNEDVLVSIKDQKQRLCSTLKLEVETKKKLEVEQ